MKTKQKLYDRPFDYDFGVETLAPTKDLKVIFTSSATGPHKTMKIHDWRDTSIISVAGHEHDEIKDGTHSLCDEKFLKNNFPLELAKRLYDQITNKTDHSFRIPRQPINVIDINDSLASNINKKVDKLHIQNINTMLGCHQRGDTLLENLSKDFSATLFFDKALDPMDPDPIDWTASSIFPNWTVLGVYAPTLKNLKDMNNYVDMLIELNNKFQSNIEFYALNGAWCSNRQASYKVNSISRKNQLKGKRTVFIFNQIGRKSVQTKHYNGVIAFVNEGNQVDPLLHAGARPKTAGLDLKSGKPKTETPVLLISTSKYPARKYLCATGQTQTSKGTKSADEPGFYNKVKVSIFNGAKKRTLTSEEVKAWSGDADVLCDLASERQVMKLDLSKLSKEAMAYLYSVQFDGLKVVVGGSGTKNSPTKKKTVKTSGPGSNNTEAKIRNNLKNLIMLLGKSSLDIRYMVDKNFKVSLYDALKQIPFEYLGDRLGECLDIDIATEIVDKIFTKELQQIFENYEN